MHVTRGKDLNPQPSGNSAMFTGQVSRAGISDQSSAQQLFLGRVSFSPGGRTVWHSHSFEQGLVIVEGKGIVASEERENVVEPGDVVIIAPNEKHWHGATETTGMTHIAINGPGQTTPMEPVQEIKTKVG
jgi:quercetin dioxygenase-like cupin family protein